MSTSEVVLLLRDPSEDDPDPYEKAFADAGFIPTSCPVLKCEPCNLDDLKNLLTVPSNYSGLIFPSKNAVKSLEISLGANPEVAQGKYIHLQRQLNLCSKNYRVEGQVGICSWRGNGSPP
eukprot:Colp12_sorted_trinity150504_noHs@17522